MGLPKIDSAPSASTPIKRILSTPVISGLTKHFSFLCIETETVAKLRPEESGDVANRDTASCGRGSAMSGRYRAATVRERARGRQVASGAQMRVPDHDDLSEQPHN